MKKFILLLAIPVSVHAQLFINKTENNIKNIFKDNIFRTGVTQDGEKYMSTRLEEGELVIYFENNLSIMNLLVLNKDEDIDSLKKEYSKRFNKLTDNDWLYRKNKDSILMKLIYDDEIGRYIIRYGEKNY